MNYQVILPPPTLTPYVRFFWVLEGEVSAGDSYTHRSMADGCAEMIFHYKSQFEELTPSGAINAASLSVVSGPSRKFSRFTVKANFGIFGVYLYPFALTKFFDLPASAVADQLPELDLLIGQEGKDLEERIMLAADNKKRVGIITSFLEKQLAHNNDDLSRIASVVSTIIRQKGNTSLGVLADQYCLSTRQFERRFKELAGFGPKLFSRIIRFQTALTEYGKPGKSLTEIAYDCGYFDQSHFIHDFKEFSGFHPGQYFSGKAEGIEWRE